jgi:hypothetical protein
MQKMEIHHAKCGGVSSGVWDICIYQRDSKPQFCPTSLSSRDMSNVLNCKTQGRPCPATTITNFAKPQVIEIRQNTYHGGRLLPWDASQSWIVAPCISSPTWWVWRHLTGAEMLKILAVPKELGESLSSEEIKTLCQDCMHIPLKVVINILDTVTPNPFWETIQEALFRCIKKAKITLETISDSAMETDTKLEEEPSLAPLPTISALDRNAKATKLDDAKISEYLWNETIFPSGGLGKSKPSTC